MKILHTSDWHLGSSLHGRKRYEEHGQFLDWLVRCIEAEQIDVLLVAGDIFDSGTPGNRAMEIYYEFLNKVAAIKRLSIVIAAGNHDSPSLLNAPKSLLKQLRIHIIGSASSDVSDEILFLHTEDGRESLIVCAVPYLRDRDIRMAEPGESISDKTRKVLEGIEDHYRQVWAIANELRQDIDANLPIIAMGHLFVEGGETIGDDGVRELYLGNHAGISASTIGNGFAYLALGHLHLPKRISIDPECHYCGSPLPIGFGDAGKEKRVVVVTFHDNEKTIETISVPRFRELIRIKGDLETVETELRNLRRTGRSAWVEVNLVSDFEAGTAQRRLRETVEGSGIEILKIGNESSREKAIRAIKLGEALGDLDEIEVFTRCLNENNVPEGDREELFTTFKEILASIQEDDPLAI